MNKPLFSRKNHSLSQSTTSWSLRGIVTAFCLIVAFLSTLVLTIAQAKVPVAPVAPVAGTAIRNTREFQDWPAISVEGVGHELVHKGSTFIDNITAILWDSSVPPLFDTFLTVYENRPDKVNICGIRINHALALFTIVHYLQPTTIIESGVNAGQSTYFMRAAAPEAHIISIDPEDKPICGQEKRWIDTSGKTEYLTGKKFQDMYDIDWNDRIHNKKTLDPSTTIAFLDDHMGVLTRLPPLIQAGIRHVVVDDNYNFGKGATPEDLSGMAPKQLFYQDTPNSRWLWHNLVSYREFPPLIPSIMAKKNTEPKDPHGHFMVAADSNTDRTAPILRPDLSDRDQQIFQNAASRLGLTTTMEDIESYRQWMAYTSICYMEVVPMAPAIVDRWKCPKTTITQ